MIIDKLIERINETKFPGVIGLDPRLDFIPGFIKAAAFKEHGETHAGAAAAILAFNKGLIDALCDIAPAVKPQIAFYEAFGAAGVAAYIDTVKYAKSKGLIVIGDVKRGDIATTAQAYSSGHIGQTLGEPAFDQDFITVNPYLGDDSVTPYLDDCKTHDRGLFVLVKTSNPGCGDFQDLPCEGKAVYEHVGEHVAKLGEALVGKHGYSAIGAVVGATKPEQARKLRAAMPRTFFLVPGYGAQGGSAADAKAAFAKDGGGAIVNNSRGIIAAYLSERFKRDETQFAEAARAAAIAMREDLA